jgi:hypothetical protein
MALVELSGLAVGESHPKLLEPLEILNFKERKESRVKRKKYSEGIASARASLTEVCSESSLQPLLQLYLVLPCLLTHMTCPDWSTPLSSAFTLYNIQLYSIVFSVLSLAWSFTAYIAIQKKGALSFQNNFPGRILLLLWCIFQICGRLLLLTLMGYLFEKFWIIICLVAGHVATIWLLFFCQNRSKGKTRNVLLNSFSNIYLQILIEEEVRSESEENVKVKVSSESKNLHEEEIVKVKTESKIWIKEENVTLRSESSHRFSRQNIIVDVIHFVENTLMLIVLLLHFKDNVTVRVVAGSAYAATIFGLASKMEAICIVYIPMFV